jgi:hypothetical protein
VLHIGHRRSADLDARVAPGFDAPRGISHPSLTDAQPGDEGDAAIDDDDLAVVSAEPPEGAVEARRIEAPDLDAGLPERSPESARGMPQPAEPIVDETNADAFARLGRQQLGELPPGGIFVDDVTLEVDRAFGGADRLQPAG